MFKIRNLAGGFWIPEYREVAAGIARDWVAPSDYMKATMTLSLSVVTAGNLTSRLRTPKTLSLIPSNSLAATTASRVLGYVVMPEHMHLLVSEPSDHEVPLSKVLQALKISVSRRLAPRPFWQKRNYDCNAFTHNKRVEKLKYMHRNPIKRGLVERADEWRWSSYRHYLLDEPGPVQMTRL
ncbi:transposase [Edaphobacter bradus]|uniref:transposase n=1 Tax=Edaphobacter bradus TaxID=2259016 RepID=UPI0021DFCB39|nr:transposase [Edaphobacter bradus]